MASIITGQTNKNVFEGIIKSFTAGATAEINGTKFQIGKSDKIDNPLLFAFRDSSGTLLSENILPSIRTDRFQIGSVVDNFINTSGVNSLVSDASGKFFAGMNAAGEITQGVASAVGTRTAEASKKIEGYVSPIVDTLDAINKIGKDFDELIKDTFLVTVFKLKGPEILCMMFCIVVSFIPCEIRQRLYDALVAVRQGLATVNSTIAEVNRMAKDPIELPVSAQGSIAENIAKLFKPAESKTPSISSAAASSYTQWSSDFTKGKKTQSAIASQLQVPDSVKTIIQNLIMLLSCIAKGQISIPVGFEGNASMWSIGQLVMSLVKIMMIQMMDEFLTKVVANVENMLKKIVPQQCIGNIAGIFINKIMQAIRDLKDYLLELIKAMFGDSETFKIKWKKFGWYYKEIYDLLGMLKALNLIIAKFPDLIMACGISPCENDPRMQDVTNAINNGNLIPQTSIPANIKATTFQPPNNNLEDIARNFAAIVKIDPNTVFMDKNTLTVSTPNAFAGAPAMIQNLVNTPEFLTALGESYTVYKDPTTSSINIVYSFNRMCGQNGE